ncbi:MAG: tetratricopeptide repeat protein [Sediminibacterium sp.]
MKRMLVVTVVGLLVACGPDKTYVLTNPVLSEVQSPEVVQQINLINQFPDSIPLREYSVDVLDSLGARNEALRQLDTLIKWDSLNAGYWNKKADLLERNGDTSGALRSYRYSARIYRSPDVLLRAANLFAEKRNDTALIIVNSITEEWTDRTILSHANFIRGIYFARKAMTEQAQQSFDACIRFNYQYLEAHMEKGFLLWDAGNVVGAKKIFKLVVQLKGTYPDGYYWLAKCEEKLKDSTNAKEHFLQANRLDANLTIPEWTKVKGNN